MQFGIIPSVWWFLGPCISVVLWYTEAYMLLHICSTLPIDPIWPQSGIFDSTVHANYWTLLLSHRGFGARSWFTVVGLSAWDRCLSGMYLLLLKLHFFYMPVVYPPLGLCLLLFVHSSGLWILCLPVGRQPLHRIVLLKSPFRLVLLVLVQDRGSPTMVYFGLAHILPVSLLFRSIHCLRTGSTVVPLLVLMVLLPIVWCLLSRSGWHEGRVPAWAFTSSYIINVVAI